MISAAASEWIAHDPDPVTAAELLACSDEELEERFAQPLTFGTAGLRGPLRAAPSGMNLAVVMRTTWAVAQVLNDRGFGGSTSSWAVTPGTAPRSSHSQPPKFLPREGFYGDADVRGRPDAGGGFRARHLGASAGIQITASHNPPSDNGYKVYFDGGLQVVPPTDREIETPIGKAPHADEIAQGGSRSSRCRLDPAVCGPRAACPAHTRTARIAFTAMHGVGGEYALDAFVRAGFTDVHVVESSSRRPRLPHCSRSPIRRSRAQPMSCSNWRPT